MFVLGIDPGLARTGYAILTEAQGRVKPEAAGVIRTDAAAPLAERLGELFADLEALIAEYRPAEAAIEEVFVNKNLHTATAVGRASGVALLAVHRAGIPVHEYTPTAVKSAVAGYGNADKVQVQALVARRLGLEAAPEPADAADACAVALCHLQSRTGRRLAEAGR
jgi:crossover junction endodeoxyribonuclease RuvC